SSSRTTSAKSNDMLLRFLFPAAAGICTRLPFSGVRILDESLAIPNHASDVKLVVQYSIPELPIPDQGQGSPKPATRSRNVLSIQCPHCRTETLWPSIS